METGAGVITSACFFCPNSAPTILERNNIINIIAGLVILGLFIWIFKLSQTGEEVIDTITDSAADVPIIENENPIIQDSQRDNPETGNSIPDRISSSVASTALEFEVEALPISGYASWEVAKYVLEHGRLSARPVSDNLLDEKREVYVESHNLTLTDRTDFGRFYPRTNRNLEQPATLIFDVNALDKTNYYHDFIFRFTARVNGDPDVNGGVGLLAWHSRNIMDSGSYGSSAIAIQAPQAGQEYADVLGIMFSNHGKEEKQHGPTAKRIKQGEDGFISYEIVGIGNKLSLFAGSTTTYLDDAIYLGSVVSFREPSEKFRYISLTFIFGALESIDVKYPTLLLLE